MDQVRVEVFSKRTDVGSADRLTVGEGVAGVAGVADPPPPPPPQDVIKIKDDTKKIFLNLNIINHKK